MTVDEMIKILEAFRDGKQIQNRPKGDDSLWHEGYPVWDFDRFIYRVKPEPREFQVAINKKNHSAWIFNTEEDFMQNELFEYIKVREVVE